MTNTRQPRPDLRFTVAVEPQSFGYGEERYLVVNATTVVFDLERDQPEWVWPRDYGVAAEYASLVVRAQAHISGDGASELYGYGARFDRAGAITLSRAESMTKVLRSLERKLTALSDRLGHPVGFAGYMAHVATALGMPEHCFGRRSTLAPDGYQWMNANDLRWWCNEQLATWRKANGVEPVGQAA